MPYKHGASEEYALSEEELQLLWNECKELADKVLVGLTAFCGLRASEATHFRLAWIRQEAINIPSQVPCGCWECAKRGYWKPKSKAGIRAVPIPAFLRPVLAEYLAFRPDGLGITRQSAWYKTRDLAAKAKLQNKVFPHSLRSTYATMLASKGMEATAICYLLGWSRLEVAQSYVRIARAKTIAIKQIKEIWG